MEYFFFSAFDRFELFQESRLITVSNYLILIAGCKWGKKKTLRDFFYRFSCLRIIFPFLIHLKARRWLLREKVCTGNRGDLHFLCIRKPWMPWRKREKTLWPRKFDCSVILSFVDHLVLIILDSISPFIY